MDIRKIKKLIKLVSKFKISELEISEGEESIRISYNSYLSTMQKNPTPFPSASLIDTDNDNEKKDPYLELKEKENLEKDSLHFNYNKKSEENYLIRSPMVGIFYYISHHDSKPFVQIGQKVNIGDTLCVIEAMKMMNQIQSENSGTIKSIFPNNGQSVEFNEPLFLIEKNNNIT